jgi:hypothetical protein
MPDPPNYAFEPQSPRDSGCLRMVLAGLLGVIVGVLLTIVVEARIVPGLFDRVHDLFSRKPVAEAPPLPAAKELEQEAQRHVDAVREMEEMVRQKQEELRKDLKKHQEEVEGKDQ